MIRVVAMIGAFILMGAGVVMMLLGIQADGAIDLTASFTTASLRTGSAGLFVLLFGFFIVLSALVIRSSGPVNGHHSPIAFLKSPVAVFVALIGALLVSSIVVAILASRADGNVRSGLGMLSGLLAMTMIGTIIGLYSLLERER